MRHQLGSIALTCSILVLSTSLCSADEAPKRTLKTNYQEVYNLTPGAVDSFTALFSEGMFYGRLRSNTFYFNYETEAAGNSHLISGLGGSLIYKSATLNDIDMGGALYYSRAFFKSSDDPVDALKPGKDVLSRYDYVSTGNKSMGVLGQAYLRYRGIPETEIIAGRQLVETFYTKSNDTKMVPNTFDGLVVETTALPDTGIKLAYLYEQKLRDHTQAHSVLVYGDANSSSSVRPEWSENDDSAMHKGLTYTRLEAAGVSTKAPLIVGDLHNTSITNLKIDASFYAVPEMLSEVMGEVNYKIGFGDLSLTPGVRYIKQFDNGAGAIGGAAYNGRAAADYVDPTTKGTQPVNRDAYTNPDSLNSQMVAARLVGAYSNYKLNLGYTQIFDEADLVTPWRGFPTSGYTRSMGIYNWMANTKSYRIELQRNASNSGIYKDLFVQASFLHVDADENKGFYDMNYYYVGFVQNIPALVELQWRLRLGYADLYTADADFLDSRFELNYLF